MQPEILEFWIDANLPPSLARWLSYEFKVNAKSFEFLGLLTATDVEVYQMAVASENVVIITTKDIDYVEIAREDLTPKILLVSTGNISNEQLKSILLKAFPPALDAIINSNSKIIEITR